MTEWLEIADLANIPRLGARVVRTPAGDVAVFRTADDSLFALRDRCPHRGGPLSEGIVHGTRVTCPLHNWVIELDRGEALAPDRGCVEKFAVRHDGTRVWLRLDALEGAA